MEGFAEINCLVGSEEVKMHLKSWNCAQIEAEVEIDKECNSELNQFPRGFTHDYLMVDQKVHNKNSPRKEHRLRVVKKLALLNRSYCWLKHQE